ncbi:acyl-CoA dehydrogenase [Paenibacillus sp. IHB B 3084]|uniref:acyl-CoA dehydrogenase family protein n=1 Tax=Paenibacillus sp. IHB B 3084 TaxID=867076 RepID=UPI0007218B07|nr:acyl-CoA dehydrogenase family protein [Paenibacillus sp. IHB B 3084]ALP36899.1 acyl-CoA dehydrogenase [Paenibacillus sp. IHB B 3084]
MSLLEYGFATTKEQVDKLKLIGTIVERHHETARKADETNELNASLLHDLKEIGYHTLSVPREYGGLGASLTEFLLYQERIAQVDAAMALALGWHHIILFGLSEDRPWQEEQYAALCCEVVERGALVNRADSEIGTGSPTRGGKPQTLAERTEQGFVLNGTKAFTSLSTALDYFIVSASDTETGGVSEFLIPKEALGVSINRTWNTVGMRATASHDLVLKDVQLPEHARVHQRQPSRKNVKPGFFLLNIPAVYLGIALAARQEAIQFASSYQPNSLPHPIIELPHIRQKLGQIELELTAARHLLYGVAARWQPNATVPPEQANPDLGAAKVFAVQTALSVVDLAMKIVGVHSLSLSHPLQLMYRNVRFGLHNPPMEDAVLNQLTDRAIREASESK